MSFIQAITQRYTDWLHERAIRAASRDVIRYGLEGRKAAEYRAYTEMCALVRSRSPGQVKRLEIKQGIYRGR